MDDPTRKTPVTEQSNLVTKDIDVASAQDIVRLLYEADRQLFSNKQDNQGILEVGIETVMEKIIAVVCDIFEKNSSEGAIVLSGCGTSGRLAFIAARAFNRKLKQIGRHPVFHYLIAGEDEALLISKELTEDDPNVGMMDLRKLTQNCNKVLYIGITCGLSAAYVAGQLDFCLQNLDKYTPVLMGFNPIESARVSVVENWNKTFYQVAQRMSELEKDGKAFILNPIIGAEPITGSTRMKCGSTTKILLECIFSCAHLRSFSSTDCSVHKLMECYEAVEHTAFEQAENLATLVTYGGQCLNAGSHIYYISADDLGIMAIVDASECPPTFGSDVDDVRGFVVGGFDALGNQQGDLSCVIEISAEYFEAKVAPLLTKNDMIMFLSGSGDFDWISHSILKSDAHKMFLCFTDSTVSPKPGDSVKHYSTTLHSVVLPQSLLASLCTDSTIEFCSQFFKEMACKWTCNVISTGAHILKGKVYENFMIDVKVRNNKLFHRAVSLVQRFGDCSKEEAWLALLKSIHDTDTLTEIQQQMPVSEHIKMATNGHKVVSTAIIIARQKCQVEDARALLKANPVIRNALASCLGQGCLHT